MMPLIEILEMTKLVYIDGKHIRVAQGQTVEMEVGR